MNIAFAAWKLTFQLSPIILTNGIASEIGMLPIISLTEALNFVDGILSGGENIELDDFFAEFEPIPGATLIDQNIGKYPFANQAVAANAVIAQPLAVSMRMICPVREPFGYPLKLATMIALQNTLVKHNGSGGTYTIATPTYFYTNCVMTGMRDISTGETNQTQFVWQLDFEQPLLTLQSIQAAQASLINKITNATKVTPDASGNVAWSGAATTVAQPPTFGAVSTVPAASGAGGAGVAGAVSAFGG